MKDVGTLLAFHSDPNLPAGLLQSGPTASHDFSCFASTKRPFVISHTRPSADVYGDQVGDGTRLSAVIYLSRLLPLVRGVILAKWRLLTLRFLNHEPKCLRH